MPHERFPFFNRLPVSRPALSGDIGSHQASRWLYDHLQTLGRAVILSDGDVVFQPHKVRRSGLYDAVNGEVLIYIHKEHELAEVERLYPAAHYVMVDDKLRLLSAVKAAWDERLTTVFVRQGHYAFESKETKPYPTADITVERLDELLRFGLEDFTATP